MIQIAVLMSTYNGAKFLREQIDSVLNQKGNFSLRLIVRDDGSKDDTVAILEEYALAGKLEWYTGKNLGPGYSFLDLLRQHPGYDYYAFADQDDYWLPDKINSGLQTLDGVKSPAIYCANAELVDGELKSLGKNVYTAPPKTDFQTIICAGGILGCTMVLNQPMARILQEYPLPEKIVLHDYYAVAVCAAVGGKILYNPAPGLKYRQHGNNVVGVSHNLQQKIRAGLGGIIQSPKVTIAEQTQSVLRVYDSLIPEGNKPYLVEITKYRDNAWNRVKLALSGKTTYMNIKASIRLRLTILLGNR